MGGVSTKLITKNSTIPIKKSQIFSTAADGQVEVELKVLQGEREMAQDNKMLGRFSLTGIPPQRRGTPQIEVTFDIDVNGIVHVTAMDKGTGKAQSIQCQSSGGLSRADIDRMVKDAEVHHEEDVKRRESTEVKNEAESVCYQTQNSMDEYSAQLSEDAKNSLKEGIASVRSKMDSGSAEEIRAAVDELRRNSYNAFGSISKGAGGSSSSSSSGDSGSSSSSGSDTFDGETVNKK